MPARTRSSWRRAILPIRSASCCLSSAMMSETFATESFGSPVARARTEEHFQVRHPIEVISERDAHYRADATKSRRTEPPVRVACTQE